MINRKLLTQLIARVAQSIYQREKGRRVLIKSSKYAQRSSDLTVIPNLEGTGITELSS